MAYEIYCEHCGKKVLKYEKWERKYKSPIANCKKCGREYLDPRCHELAVEGIPEREFKVSNDIVLLIAGCFVAWRGCYLLRMHMLGMPDFMQWVVPAVVLLLGIGMIIAAGVDAVRLATGLKRKKYERLLEESESRMQDDVYYNKLEELGYIR